MNFGQGGDVCRDEIGKWDWKSYLFNMITVAYESFKSINTMD